MADRPQIAYWFAAEPKLSHDDGRPVVLGETLWVEPPLKLCERGLHWSEHPFDALKYAGGSLLYRVRPEGDFLIEDDKGCSLGRTALDMRDATKMLRAFARAEALSVIHLWDAPEIVRRYLETGDESIRNAARAAAWAAADAAWTARDAAWTAARDAARAARAAAWAAARNAARAARDAARAAADAARAATDAARAAARNAARAATDAARAAALSASRDRFATAVNELFGDAGPRHLPFPPSVVEENITRALETCERRGAERMREAAKKAALGYDPDRHVTDPAAIGYIQGRRDAAADIGLITLDPD